MRRTVSLPLHTIDLWSASLAVPPLPVAALEGVLTLDERIHAARQLPENRHLAMLSRGMLRLILACYLGCEPGEVPLGVTAQGKPVLDPNTVGLHFNLTHTRDLALYAVSSCVVGIDMEYGARWPSPGLLQRICSAEEYRAWFMLSEQEQPLAALRLWTQKEALLKAGEAQGKRTAGAFVFTASTQRTAGEPCESGWQLINVDPAPGYCATLCYPAEFGYPIRQRQWSPEEVAA